MSWRKYLVRFLVFSTAGGLALAILLYQRWTNPAAVREQVIEQLGAHFPGATVRVDSARMRLLGGIAVAELRMARRDDSDKTEFAYVPNAVIYHDKEQLVEGKLAVRKVELDHPQLRVVRGRDGRWNIDGILGPVRPDEPIPTITVHSGTILIEDRSIREDIPPLEIKDVSFTMLNDPLSTVIYQLKGSTDLFGPLRGDGAWQRVTGDIKLSLQAPRLSIGAALVERLAAYYPQAADYANHLRGNAEIRAELNYQPWATHPWSHQVDAHLSDCKLDHPKLPLPLDHVDARVHCIPGEIKLERLTAHAAGADVAVKGSARDFSADTDFQADVRLTNLTLRSQIFDSLPPSLKEINKDYAPEGPVHVVCHCERTSGKLIKRCRVEPVDLSARCVKFPYLLQHVTGSLEQETQAGRPDVLRVDLRGYAGPRPISIEGSVLGAGAASEVNFKIRGDDVPIDGDLVAALPQRFQSLAHSFHPSGLVNFEANVFRAAHSRQFVNRYLVRFHDCAVRYAVFPYPLEHVGGILDIQEDHWEFRDFAGRRGAADVHCRGRSARAADGEHVGVDIEGTNVPLDGELYAALMPDLKEAWSTFSPKGHIAFNAHVEVPPGSDSKPDVDVKVTAAACSVRPAFFPYDLNDLSASIHYGKREVYVDNVRARHGSTVIALDGGDVRLKDQGGVWAQFNSVRCSPVQPDADFLNALPRLLREVCVSLKLKDPVDLQTRLTIETRPNDEPYPIVYWDGEIRFRNASLDAGVLLEHLTGKAACRGRYDHDRLLGLVGNLQLDQVTIFRQVFRDVHSRLEVNPDEPDVLKLVNVAGRLYGGDVGAEARIDFHSRLQYQIKLVAAQLNLEEFGRQNLPPDKRVSGLGSAQLYLQGQGADVNELTGQGSFDVPDGRLLDNLPVLLDLLKVLGLRKPDGTVFNQAHAGFTVRGPRLVVNRLEFLGDSFSVRGQGEMNLDGTDLNLDFYAVGARTMLQILPPLLKEIPAAFSKYFFMKIQVRGRIGDVRILKEPLPIVVDSIKDLLERMSKPRSGQPPKSGQ